MADSADLKPPNVSQWMQIIDVTDAVLLTTSTFCSTIVVTVAFIQFYLVNKYVREENVRHNLWWIVFMLPITSFCSLLGMYFPRSGMFLFILAICYLMVCLMIIAHLMQNLFGGRFAMVEYMRENNMDFKLSVPPFCCCLKFLRPIQPTERNVEILEWLVSQTVFVRIILEVGTMVAFLEEMYQYHIYYTLADVVCVISLLVSIYACEILMPIADVKLKGFRVRALFNAVNVTQVLFTMQKMVFDNLLKFGVLSPGSLMLDESRSQFYSSALFCIEAFLISIWILVILNPNKTKLFDDYKIPLESGDFTENGHLVRNSTQPQIITLSREMLNGNGEED
ncbi:hypothetical protein QR680_012222 [Steinernema hermaphroditum]|uniref:Uncharacterized protein n=1 Tax=Steinernema hermaphroditum TaxID=289476 RepID=A0AA39LZH6_9BILA|nr:hypothetical protein QR680_012222 [Steinernema hermaphroditum]